MTRILQRLAVVFIVFSALTTKAENTIPRFFQFKFGGDLLWLAKSEAISDTEVLRADVPRSAELNDRARRWHEQRHERGSITREGTVACDITFTEYFSDGPDEGAVSSLDVLRELMSTRSVISGTVTASALGLHNGVPYTILEIERDDVAESVYLLYPRGEVRVQGVTFCNENPAFGDLPSAGDPIVFIASHPIDSSGRLFSTSWVVYQRASEVVTAANLRLTPAALPRSVKEFAKRLRSFQERDKRR